MARQSKGQKETVERVMHEFKHGDLETSRGTKVSNPKQAIAIALHEAGASRDESPRKNRENLRRTKARERKGEAAEGSSGSAGKTRDELYEEARRKNVPGRSKMSKAQLQAALES
jgi:hypothetical protein